MRYKVRKCVNFLISVLFIQLLPSFHMFVFLNYWQLIFQFLQGQNITSTSKLLYTLHFDLIIIRQRLRQNSFQRYNNPLLVETSGKEFKGFWEVKFFSDGNNNNLWKYKASMYFTITLAFVCFEAKYFHTIYVIWET